MSNLDNALKELFSLQRLGVKFGLDIEETLLNELGDPHTGYGVVHVAGTNGKGSVSSLVASALQELGYKTGIYISPHLVRFNERFRVNGIAISDDRLEALLGQVGAAAHRTEAQIGRHPTFFEYSTAMAFEYFRASGVQIAVVETGLGGRLDATNVCTPLLSVITRIGIDHTNFLGPDIESIAGEKGGIIKQGRPVVCGAMPDEASAVLRQIAAQRNATFVNVPDIVQVGLLKSSIDGLKVTIETPTASYGTAKIPLGGLHQLENIATAVATVETTQDILGLPVDSAAVVRGFENVQWQGRCQVIDRDPLIIIDGAHNEDGARALARWLGQIREDRPVGLIVGMCADKDIKGLLKPLSRVAERLWAVPIRNDRSISSDELAAIGSSLGLQAAAVSVEEALRLGREWAVAERGMLCIAGSLFLVGEVLEIKQIADKAAV